MTGQIKFWRNDYIESENVAGQGTNGSLNDFSADAQVNFTIVLV